MFKIRRKSDGQFWDGQGHTGYSDSGKSFSTFKDAEQDLNYYFLDYLRADAERYETSPYIWFRDVVLNLEIVEFSEIKALDIIQLLEQDVVRNLGFNNTVLAKYRIKNVQNS